VLAPGTLHAETSNEPDRDRSDRLDEGSLSTDRGQGLRAHTIGRPKVYYRAELTERILREAEAGPTPTSERVTRGEGGE
jgi:hypothetical protein